MTYPHGLYMIDSNRKWTFYEICTALKALHGNTWAVIPNDDFVYDQRMIEKQIRVPSLKEKLTSLP